MQSKPKLINKTNSSKNAMLIFCAVLLSFLLMLQISCAESKKGLREDTNKPKSAIELQTIEPPKAGEFGYISFKITAPWLQGFLELRMPETIHSKTGLHFIDSYRADMPPLAMLESYPVWHKDEKTGALWYKTETKEGLEFGGKAQPKDNVIYLEFKVKNNSDKPFRDVHLQQCLVLGHSADFAKKHTLDTTYAWIDGKFTPLNTTTPTPQEKGRKPWILMLTTKAAEDFSGAREHKDGWWVVDQTADEYIIARVSENSKHLVAITWDEISELWIMTNTSIPCLHAGPASTATINPAEEHTWKGRIFLMENKPDRLLALYKSSKP